ncbi:MAG: hypothetical protein IKB16_10110 [Lentisphaeria bacterium]|nr:hypothetical protein [Lentisphaeria bacterium]
MEYSTEKEILQPVLDHGMEEMSEVLQKLFNLAMKLERENVLKATQYNGRKDVPAMLTVSRSGIFKLVSDSVGIRRQCENNKYVRISK